MRCCACPPQFTWDNKRKHVVPAPELPALPTPAPGTHAPHTTPRAMTGTPWCADPGDTPTSAAATGPDGSSAFLTQAPPDPEQDRAESRKAKRKEERGKANREAVLRMLHEAKRQAEAEEAGPGVETVEDVLQQSKERKARIVVRWRATRYHGRLGGHRSAWLAVASREAWLCVAAGVWVRCLWPCLLSCCGVWWCVRVGAVWRRS